MNDIKNYPNIGLFNNTKLPLDMIPEYIAIKNGIKPGAAHVSLANLRNYNKIAGIIKKEGLFISHSNFRIIQSMGDRCVDFNDPRGTEYDTMYVFITKTKERLNKMEKTWKKYIYSTDPKYTKKSDYANLNEECAGLLGFPKCCLKEYERTEKSAEHISEELHVNNSIKNSIAPFSFLLNNFHWDSPYHLISHFPCSYNCEESKKYARKVLKAMKKEDPEYGNKLEWFLKLPILYYYFHHHITFQGEIKENKIMLKKYYTQNYKGLEEMKNLCYGNSKKFHEYKKSIKELKKGIINLNNVTLLVFK